MSEPYQYPLFLPRSQAPDTDAKMVWKAYLYAKDTGDDEEAERLLAKWQSLQPRRQGEHG